MYIGLATSVSLLFIFIISIFIISQAYAQSPNVNNFTTYQNPNLGFSIKYPSEWIVHENSTGQDDIVRFTETSESILSIFTFHVRDLDQYLDTDTMTLKSKTLEQIVNEQLSQISKPHPLGLETRLIRQNPFKFGNNSGWKIELFIGPQNEPYYYVYEVLTIANGKLYSLEYNERSLNVPQTLPIVNKIVESFHILTANEKEKAIIANPQPPPQPGYHSKISPLIDNGTLGYKTLFERTTNSQKFSPELQTLINSTCDRVRSDYPSFGSIDRNWFLANC